jgi:recombination protein RecT
MANLTILEKIDAVAFRKDNRFMEALAQSLPQQSIILAPALVRQALTIIKGSDTLQRCSEHSIFNSIAEVAQAGLSLDLHLGQCYLVPFSNIATVMYGYRGLIELARRSGEVNEIVGEIRYSKDEFSITLGSDRRLVHVPFDAPESKRGERLGAYAIADMSRSRPVFEYMSAEQIERIKNGVLKRKKSDKPSVWETEHENEMWRKTPVRRIAKRLPQSPALIPFIQAAIRDEYRQAGVRQVVEMTPEIEKVMAVEEILPEPEMKSARKSAVKEKPAKEQAFEKISKEQVSQIYQMTADLALESTEIPKALKSVGHNGKLTELPANLFTALAGELERRSKQ